MSKPTRAPGGALGHGGPRTRVRQRQVNVVIEHPSLDQVSRLAQPGPVARPWYLPRME